MSYLTSSSALRLCVWLCDDCYLQILYFNQCFPPALRTVERIIHQNSIFSNPITGFSSANRTTYPFHIFFLHTITPLTLTINFRPISLFRKSQINRKKNKHDSERNKDYRQNLVLSTRNSKHNQKYSQQH